MKPRFLGAAFYCALTLAVSISANAALVDRGGGLIYDNDFNVTWLANANVNGAMTLNDAMTWASNLSYYDSVRNVTYTDWRLPAADPACGPYYNCTGSEMGHVFYNELGGGAGQSITTTHNGNYSLFQNVQSGIYWSGTELAPNTSAWTFNFSNGLQYASIESDFSFAWAVRPGDVAVVPVPATVWLFSSGLLGLIGADRRKVAVI